VTDEQSPAEMAAAIGAARDRLVTVVARCDEQRWGGPLSDDDPRPLGVVVDHVADAYGYLGGFIETLCSGAPVEVSPEVVDRLNDEHLTSAYGVTRDEALDHLGQGSARLMMLVAGLEPEVLHGGGGQIARFAWIAARHADDHREEVEDALGPPDATG